MDIGAARQDVVFSNPGGPPIPDGDGGFTESFTDLIPDGADAPTWWMAIKPATTRDLERVAAGTVLATATLIATGRYLPGVTTETRMRWNDALSRPHTANITGVANPDGQCIDMVLTCVEIVE